MREKLWRVARFLSVARDGLSPSLLADLLEQRALRARLLRAATGFGASVGRNVEVIGLERLWLGTGTVIQSNVTLHCGSPDWSSGKGEIRIGRNGYVGHGAVLYGAGGIYADDDLLLSPGVMITSHQHSFWTSDEPTRAQPIRYAPVTIDASVWIGSGAVILPGVHLGRGCVVAAGAVVTRSVPDHALVAGVPARVTRRRADSQVGA